jgi:hypothetical protein
VSARLRRRLLACGPLDLVLQLGVVVLAFLLWRYARGAVDGGMAESFAHARDLVDAERAIGSLIEADVQRWALAAGWPAELASWIYGHAHFKGTCLALLFVYFFRRASFGFVRNLVLAAMAVSLLGYAFYPTAPPRFLPELGLDGAASVTGNSPLISVPGDPLFNPFAAVPSMHVCFALIFGCSLALLVRAPVARALFFAYPLLITFVVVATGNHFWLDAVFGAVTAAIALAIAAALARLRPEDWSFRGVPEPEPVGPVEPGIEAAPA